VLCWPWTSTTLRLFLGWYEWYRRWKLLPCRNASAFFILVSSSYLLHPTYWCACAADVVSSTQSFRPRTFLIVSGTAGVAARNIDRARQSQQCRSYRSLHISYSIWLMSTSCNRPAEPKPASELAPEPIIVKWQDLVIRRIVLDRIHENKCQVRVGSDSSTAKAGSRRLASSCRSLDEVFDVASQCIQHRPTCSSYREVNLLRWIGSGISQIRNGKASSQSIKCE
jgi:hypothetical protein